LSDDQDGLCYKSGSKLRFHFHEALNVKGILSETRHQPSVRLFKTKYPVHFKAVYFKFCLMLFLYSSHSSERDILFFG